MQTQMRLFDGHARAIFFACKTIGALDNQQEYDHSLIRRSPHLPCRPPPLHLLHAPGGRQLSWEIDTVINQMVYIDPGEFGVSLQGLQVRLAHIPLEIRYLTAIYKADKLKTFNQLRLRETEATTYQ